MQPSLYRSVPCRSSGRGKRSTTDAQPADGDADPDPRTTDERRRSMTWAQRLKRVFGIDATTCVHCGGAVRIIASVEEPPAIRVILAHFENNGALEPPKRGQCVLSECVLEKCALTPVLGLAH